MTHDVLCAAEILYQIAKQVYSPNTDFDTQENSEVSISDKQSGTDEDTQFQGLSHEFLRELHACDPSITLEEMIKIAGDKSADLRNQCCDPQRNAYQREIGHIKSTTHRDSIQIGKGPHHTPDPPVIHLFSRRYTIFRFHLSEELPILF